MGDSEEDCGSRIARPLLRHYPPSPIPYPLLNVYSAEQYGHFAQPVCSTGR